MGTPEKRGTDPARTAAGKASDIARDAEKAQFDLDIRIFRRYPEEFQCTVYARAGVFNGKALAYSLSGLNIMLESCPGISARDMITVEVPAIGVRQKAHVVWTTPLGSR